VRRLVDEASGHLNDFGPGLPVKPQRLYREVRDAHTDANAAHSSLPFLADGDPRRLTV
jgi:hypothetical protein